MNQIAEFMQALIETSVIAAVVAAIAVAYVIFKKDKR